jgi:type 1 glutamine amidotransferase
MLAILQLLAIGAAVVHREAPPARAARLAAHADADKVRVLIVTGGHQFEEEEFFRMFDGMAAVTWRHARFGESAEGLLARGARSGYDVLVFYDMYQDPERHRNAWLEVMEDGVGMVFLHHSLGSYRKWDDYHRIVGGRAWFGRPSEGDLHARSIPKLEVSYRVHIANPTHPITRGLRDFDLVDETYARYEVDPGVEVLLTADDPDSDRVIGWTHRYQRSPVVYLQPGHDHSAYRNASFRTLVERSILWTAGRLAAPSDGKRK